MFFVPKSVHIMFIVPRFFAFFRSDFQEVITEQISKMILSRTDIWLNYRKLLQNAIGFNTSINYRMKMDFLGNTTSVVADIRNLIG